MAPLPQIPPAGAFPVLPAQHLLAARREYINRIEEVAAATPIHFERFYLGALRRFAEFVQQAPASQAHHHAHAGGLLDHALDVAATALKLRQAHLLPAGAPPEEVVLRADLWTYAVFTAALMHDVAKPAVDQQVTVFDASGNSWRWDPWAGAIGDDPRAFWYRIEFVVGRKYRLHESASLVLASRVLGSDGLSWLSSDREAFGAWLAYSSGDHAQAGLLGDILTKADGLSVARNLGADRPTAAAAAGPRSIPLHEKLTTALRHLVDQGELPLNRNGAAGWRVGDDLWLVSKRCADALRTHLVAMGHSGIPTTNDRLFDAFQDHGILIPNGDRAIWRATVQGTGWSNRLTLLRMPVTRVWGSDPGPDSFEGEVIPTTSEGEAPDGPSEAPEEHDDLAQDSSAATTTASQPVDEKPVPKAAPIPTSAPASRPVGHGGDAFLQWLAAGIRHGSLEYNNPAARVHVVPEGVLLASPAIFQDYAGDKGIPWEQIQKQFLKLKLHERTEGGTNVHRYAVVGENRSTVINGVLLRDPKPVFGNAVLPQPNPHLKRM